jgi:hypothetical protein
LIDMLCAGCFATRSSVVRHQDAVLHALWCTLQVSEMVYEESVRCGKVLGIAVPVPPAEVADGEVFKLL